MVQIHTKIQLHLYNLLNIKSGAKSGSIYSRFLSEEEFRKRGCSLCTSWLNESASLINFGTSCSACDTRIRRGQRAGIWSGTVPHQQMPLWEWNLDSRPLRRGLLTRAFPFPCSCSFAQHCMFEAVSARGSPTTRSTDLPPWSTYTGR